MSRNADDNHDLKFDYDQYEGRAPLDRDMTPTEFAEYIGITEVKDHTIIGTPAKIEMYNEYKARYDLIHTNTAVKHDSNKPDLSLLDRAALDELARVLQFGAGKYGKNNWRTGFDHSRLISAAMRHIAQYNDGENNDSESGLNHLAHAMANLMFMIRFIADNTGKDDRYDK